MVLKQVLGTLVPLHLLLDQLSGPTEVCVYWFNLNYVFLTDEIIV